MLDFAFAPSARSHAPIEDESARFPVRRVYCVGRNFGAHVREMGGEASAQPPLFFTKPGDALVTDGADVPYPRMTRRFHHEIELVVALDRGGADVSVDRALDLVFGYAAGVDLTRRDLQEHAKATGQPWDSGKGFDASAVIGAIRRRERSTPPLGALTLEVDGARRQDGRLDDMIWSVAQIIAEASKLWTLAPGDLIFTGTPEGVGPLEVGERVEGRVGDLPPVVFRVAPPR